MSTINLLPDDYVAGRLRKRANAICLTLFLVVMAGVLGAQIVCDMQVRNTHAVLQRVNADYAEAARLIEQMQKLQAQESVLRKRTELTASLIERVPRSTLLAIITQALPEHASLSHVSLELQRVVARVSPDVAKTPAAKSSSGKAVAAVADSNMILEIIGMAGTDVEVARFIASLARSPMIECVDLVYSQEKEVNKLAVREFRVTATLKGGADAIELQRPAEAVSSNLPVQAPQSGTGRPL